MKKLNQQRFMCVKIKNMRQKEKIKQKQHAMKSEHYIIIIIVIIIIIIIIIIVKSSMRWNQNNMKCW